MTWPTRDSDQSEGMFHNIRSPETFARHPFVGVLMFIFGRSGLAHTVVELVFRKRNRVEATRRAELALPR